MSHWMRRCEDVSRKVSQSMDARLPLNQRMAIRLHMMMCRYCKRFRRQLISLRQISRIEDTKQTTESSPEKLSEETKKRIKEKLRSFH